MVRGNLCHDMGAKLLGQLYHADGVAGADMLDIDKGTGVQSQHAVAGHQNILCSSRRAANAEVLGDCAAVDAVIGDKRRIFFVEA